MELGEAFKDDTAASWIVVRYRASARKKDKFPSAFICGLELEAYGRLATGFLRSLCHFHILRFRSLEIVIPATHNAMR